MSTITEKGGRLTARVSNPVAEKLMAAVNLTGATLSQFLIQAALEKANQIIEHEHTIRFLQEDAVLLMTLLKKPNKPNAKLKKAFLRHKEKIANGT